MREVVESAGIAVTISALVALAVCWLGSWRLPAAARPYSAAAAFAAAYCLAAIMVAPWGNLAPTRHFHWPFYLALAGAVLGPLAAAADSQRQPAWRWQLLGAVLAALVVVPRYPSLFPPRWVQIPLVAAYFFLLSAAILPLFRRTSEATLVGLLSLSALTVAGIIALLVSLSFGISALTAAAAMAGCGIALWLAPRPAAAAGLAVCYALVIGSWAYIGARQSSPWLWGSLAAAAAPLALWLVVAQPETANGRWKTAVQVAIVVACLAAAAAWGFMTVR